jgi:hypothetical protein
MPLSSHISTASGQKVLVAEGTRLVFGRGPGVDLIVAAGRGLSRRAGLVTAMAAGAWIANISRTHALYVEGDGYQVRLPRMEHDGEPASGWFVHTGTALVGSRAMLDEGQSLIVTVTGQYDEVPHPAGWAADTELAGAELAGAGAAADAGRTGNRVAGAGTGLTDEGEWTDEVCAARTTGQSAAEDGGLAYAGLAAAGPGGPGQGGQAGTGQGGQGGTGRGAQAGTGRGSQGGAGRNGQSGPGHGGAPAGSGLGTGTASADGPNAAGASGEPADGGLAARDAARDGDGTLLPFYLDPMTKLFLVALIWCRPWLDDPSATRPLPRTPEIARSALEVTGAYHELERFDADPEYRDLLSARVAEHIKVLRRKIADRGLAAAAVRLSDEVAVRILIEHGIITSADLSRLDDPAWRSRQEDLWWTQS